MVLWAKVNGSNPSQYVNVARMFKGTIMNITERFYMNEDYSLTIRDLKVSDEGLFICQVAVLNQLIRQNYTQLSVNGKFVQTYNTVCHPPPPPQIQSEFQHQ